MAKTKTPLCPSRWFFTLSNCTRRVPWSFEWHGSWHYCTGSDEDEKCGLWGSAARELGEKENENLPKPNLPPTLGTHFTRCDTTVWVWALGFTHTMLGTHGRFFRMGLWPILVVSCHLIQRYWLAYRWSCSSQGGSNRRGLEKTWSKCVWYAEGPG